ncbi:MAG: hypothetical protein JWO63_1568, partial [Frankiales bacterium]|nr:hypothetical protein [Frankiales bacterium]
MDSDRARASGTLPEVEPAAELRRHAKWDTPLKRLIFPAVFLVYLIQTGAGV